MNLQQAIKKIRRNETIDIVSFDSDFMNELKTLILEANYLGTKLCNAIDTRESIRILNAKRELVDKYKKILNLCTFSLPENGNSDII